MQRIQKMRFTKTKLLSSALALTIIPTFGFEASCAAAKTTETASGNLDATTTPGATGKSRHSPAKKSSAGKIDATETTTSGKKDSGMSAGYGNGNGMPTGNSGSSEPQHKTGAATSSRAGMNPQGPSHNSETPPH